MKRFSAFRSRFILLDKPHIDTDQIIPARFLKQTHRDGLGQGLFFDWRYDQNGRKIPEQILNQREQDGVKILVAAENFGCGSSREHAVWALHDYGFRAIVSPSIGDIFKSNALKNGLLPIEIPPSFYQSLVRNPNADLHIDLEAKSIRLKDDLLFNFAIDPFARICLLQGTDQLGYLVQQEAKIHAYEERSAL